MIVHEVLTQDEDWDSFVASCPFGDVLQAWEWGEAKSSEVWSARRVRVSVEEDGQRRTVGQAQVLIRTLPMGRRLFYVPRGPVLDYGANKAKEILRLLIDWLKQEAIKVGGLMIKIGPAVGQEQVPGIKELLNGLDLQVSGKSVQTKHTRIVDLSAGEAEILQSFDKDTRNLVRRAAKEGIVVDRFSDPEEQKGLRFFHNIYTLTADRASFSARPWGHFVKLWQTLAAKGMAYIYLASFEDAPMAGSMVLRLGSRAYQLYGASRRDDGKKYATYALQWAMMQDLKAMGVVHYDLWGVAPDDNPDHPLAGVTLFKKGFGGRQVDYVGDFDLPIPPFKPLYKLIDKVATRRL